MPRTRIKICGLREPAHAAHAAAAGADAVGLVFVPQSKRYIGPADSAAHAVIDALPPFVEPVALFADESPARIRQITARLNIRTVQLHGSEPPSIAAELSGLRIIRAIPFDPAALEQVIRDWIDAAGPRLAGMLIDAPVTNTNALRGGSGRTLDWHALARFNQQTTIDPLPPLILAGGLNPENVGEAIHAVQPCAVDVSSGVEREPGVKDPKLITAFIKAASAAARNR